MTAPNPILPFGKYKGQRAGDVDDVGYLDWMLSLDNLREPFKTQLKEHLESRDDWKRYEPE